MRQVYLVVFGCLLALVLLWTIMRDQQVLSSVVSIIQPRVDWTENSPPSRDLDHAVSDLSIKGYLTRDEALSYEPLTNVNNVVSMKRSLIKVLGKHNIYRVGDKITLSVTLIEENGRRRKRGGDKLHVRIFNTTYGAYAPGSVVDLDNGTHTAEIPALWPGVSIVSIYLAYPREDIRVLYATMQQNFTTRHVLGRYESGEAKEVVLCHPAREYFPPSEELCDFTRENGGMSWYCEKPKHKQLFCKDWASIRGPNPFYFLQTDAERLAFRRQNSRERNITVLITGRLQTRDELPDCSSVPNTKTWIQHNPSGFFYQDRWNLTFCNLPNDEKSKECLFGRHFTIIGDSTSRQWYSYLRDYLNCTQVTEKWTRKAWHKRAMCENKSLNFTALIVPHAQPHFPGDYWRLREHGVNSTVSYLDSIVDEKLVIVVHMFSHLKHYRSEIFQERMNAISSSVGRLLVRNKNVRVLVKGPHTYFNTFAYKYYMYRAIIKDAFKDLYDRVVFMEQGDMTLAKHNRYSHPDIDTVREAVRQLLGFIC